MRILLGILVGLGIAIGVASASGTVEPNYADVSTATFEVDHEIEGVSLRGFDNDDPKGSCRSGRPPRCLRESCGWSTNLRVYTCPVRDQCVGKEYCNKTYGPDGYESCSTSGACSDSLGGGGGIVIQ